MYLYIKLSVYVADKLSPSRSAPCMIHILKQHDPWVLWYTIHSR